jgi:5-methylcytosine-specific restriction endonuclease McrA
MKALENFVEYINSDDGKNDEPIIEETLNEEEKEFKHKTKRLPSERLKVQVLMRDGNKCSLCGITVTGENIHFDHIKPWVKGGETVLENLQILCKLHNLAKGTLEYPEK